MEHEHDYIYNTFHLEHIRNRNETRVIHLMQQRLAGMAGFCGCRVCVEDVYAGMMNSITPHYAQVGSVVLKHQPAEETLLASLQEVVARVEKHPRHT